MLNNRMSTAAHIASVCTDATKSVDTVESTAQRKHFCSYPKIVSYLLQNFANDETIA